MNKRLTKRHKRQVSRARERIRLSEPDVRTQEQLQAARDASRPAGARRNAPSANGSILLSNKQTRPVADTAVKGEA